MRVLPRLIALTALGFGLASVASGCGSSDSDSDAGGSSAGGAAGSGAGGAGAAAGGSAGGQAGGSAGGQAGSGGGKKPQCTEEGDLDLGGTWLMRVRLDVTMKSDSDALVQVCPTDQSGASDLLLVVNMTQSGTEISALSATVCNFTLPEVTAVAGMCDPTITDKVKTRVEASKALLAALPAVKAAPIKAKLDGTQPGATFSPDRFVYTLGSKAGGDKMATWTGGGSCDNSTSPLGTGEGCEAMCVSSCDDVVDADGDKYPGITLTVCGFGANEGAGTQCNADDPSQPGVTLQGHAGINFEVNPQLEGKAESSCSIKGNVTDAKIVYNILGGDVRLTGTALTVKSIIQAIPKFVVQPATSQFQAIRVDGKHGSVDLKLTADNPQAACEAALNNKNLF